MSDCLLCIYVYNHGSHDTRTAGIRRLGKDSKGKTDRTERSQLNSGKIKTGDRRRAGKGSPGQYRRTGKPDKTDTQKSRNMTPRTRKPGQVTQDRTAAGQQGQVIINRQPDGTLRTGAPVRTGQP
jgi:hypothetical protein